MGDVEIFKENFTGAKTDIGGRPPNMQFALRTCTSELAFLGVRTGGFQMFIFELKDKRKAIFSSFWFLFSSFVSLKRRKMNKSILLNENTPCFRDSEQLKKLRFACF